MSQQVHKILKALYDEKHKHIPLEEPGKEWFTTKQLSKSVGISPRHAHRLIETLVDDKLVTCKTFCIKLSASHQYRRRCLHYKLKRKMTRKELRFYKVNW